MAVTSSLGLGTFRSLGPLNISAHTDATKLSGGGVAISGTVAGQTDTSIFNANASSVGNPASFNGWSSAVSQLSNGNIFVAATTDLAIRYTILDGTGGTVVALTSIGEDGVRAFNPDVTGGLAGGRFAIAYENQITFGGNYDVEIEIRNNDGSFVTNLSVDSSTARDQAPSVAALNDGGFAVAWHRLVGSQTELWYAVYEGDGSVRRAPGLLDTVGSINRNPSVVALSSGGFAIAYEDNGWGAGTDIDITFARFTANGTSLGRTDISQNSGDDILPFATTLSNGIVTVGSISQSLALLRHVDPNTGDPMNSLSFSTTGHDLTQSVPVGMELGRIAWFVTDTTTTQVQGFTIQITRETTGDVANNVITGDDLVDIIEGGAGSDTIHGEDNDDVLVGGLGKDLLYGDAGADTFRFISSAETAVGAATRDVVHDWDASDVLDFESVDANSTITGDQNFTFIGLGATNHTVGEGQIKYYHFGGNTYVVGNATADTTADFQVQINGVHTITTDELLGLANAVLTGTAANDTLKGTAGADILRGGLGKDNLLGRLGADDFVFASAADTALGANRDVIHGWNSSDQLDVDLIDANTTSAGNQDFVFIGSGVANHTIGQGQIKYYQYGGNTYVVGNATADTTADFQIEILGEHNLTGSNFLGLI